MGGKKEAFGKEEGGLGEGGGREGKERSRLGGGRRRGLGVNICMNSDLGRGPGSVYLNPMGFYFNVIYS